MAADVTSVQARVTCQGAARFPYFATMLVHAFAFEYDRLRYDRLGLLTTTPLSTQK